MALIEIPGEKLLIRLWETAEKFGASVLKPWQMRREGLVSIKLRHAEILMLAQAEVEATQIKQGGLTQTVELLPAPSQPTDIQTSLQITHASCEYSHIEAITERNMKAEAVRKEIALAKAVIHAEDELKNDPSPAPDVSVSDDWLLRWRDYAAGVSSDELQSIWGKVLAGEVKAPGRYSLRTLEFLKNLSQEEAVSIEKLAAFVFNNAIYYSLAIDFVAGFNNAALDSDLATDSRVISYSDKKKWEKVFDTTLEESGITRDFLSRMSDLGIILNTETFTNGEILVDPSELQENYKKIVMQSAVMRVRATTNAKKVELRRCRITSIGKEVLKLTSIPINQNYLVALTAYIEANGYQVQIIKE